MTDRKPTRRSTASPDLGREISSVIQRAHNLRKSKTASSFRRRSSATSKLKDSRSKTIVLDIGEHYTRCGLAGEFVPRAIFANDFRDPADNRRQFARALTCPSSSSAFRWLSAEDWGHILWDHLHKVFYEHLLTSPAGRTVTLCENPFLPLPFKQALIETLFRLQVGSILQLNSLHTPVYAAALENAIIVDVGFGETRVGAVQGFHMIHESMGSTPLGVFHIGKTLRSMLNGEDVFVVDGKCVVAGVPGVHLDDKVNSRNAALKHVTDDVLYDMVARTCFVLPYEHRLEVAIEATDASVVPASLDYPVSEALHVEVTGVQRSLAAETLFFAADDTPTISELVLDCLLKCSIDARPKVIQNIFLVGGGATLPGLEARILEELHTLLVSRAAYKDKLGKLAPALRLARASDEGRIPFQPSTIAWVGASVVSSVSLPPTRYLTAEKYELGGSVVPDWTFSVKLARTDSDNPDLAPFRERSS